MSDENLPPVSASSAGAGTDQTAPDPDVASSGATALGADSTIDADRAAQYGVGPFTIREVSLLGVWLIAFIVSFFSVWVDAPVSSVLLPVGSVWSAGIDWVLTIGVPTVAVFLIVLRRFSPDGIRRVGSLAVDQFASVAFSVSAVVWLGVLWTNISRGIQTGLWLNSWVVWVEFFLMVAGVFLTVLAPFIQPFDEDFDGRPETSAHRNARPVRPVIARPAPSPAATDRSSAPFAPVPAEEASPVASPAEPEDDATAAFPFTVQEDAVEPAQAAATQAFWALSPVERDVVDENGLPLFTVGPTAWALVIEDRGDRFVVRHEDGRVGFLTDVSGVTRG